MARRLFFVDEVRGGRAEILGDDAQHLTKVLRVEAGERYEISDNAGLYLADVELARRSQVIFQVVEKLETEAPPVRLHLLPAMIKFDHFEWMLEKATEIGVGRITPVLSERSEKGLDRAAGKRMERWRRILRESAQQCRRWRMPELGEPVGFRKILEGMGLRYILEEQRTAEPVLRALPVERRAEDEVSLLVGPEGGWTDPERSAAKVAGWVAVSLGPTILRAETAATAALAIVSAAWQA